MDQLPVFLNLRGQPVLLVGDGAAADAKRRLIETAGGVVVREPGAARLAFVALDDEVAAQRTADDLRTRGLLVNVVDRPALCDFTVPAIVDRSPVIVAIGTGGASATLAKTLRERFEALLPASLGALAAALLRAHPALAVRFPKPADRRHFWDALLAPGGALDPLAGHDAVGAVDAALAGHPPAGDQHAEISVTSADPDDLTLRQLRLLSRADVIVHDAAVPPAILDRARRDALRVIAGKPAPAVGIVVTIRWTRQ